MGNGQQLQASVNHPLYGRSLGSSSSATASDLDEGDEDEDGLDVVGLDPLTPGHSHHQSALNLLRSNLANGKSPIATEDTRQDFIRKL